MTAALAARGPTLVVSTWESRCTACGGGADPAYGDHRGLDDRTGCGVMWTAVATDRDALAVDVDACRFAAALTLPHVGAAPMPRRSAPWLRGGLAGV